MKQLVSLELDPDEAADAAMPIPMDHVPRFPYGTRISLTDVEMKKLGIDPAEAQVGKYFMLTGHYCVTSVSSNETTDGTCFRMEAQMEQAEVDGDDSQPVADAPAASPGRLNYKAA